MVAYNTTRRTMPFRRANTNSTRFTIRGVNPLTRRRTIRAIKARQTPAIPLEPTLHVVQMNNGPSRKTLLEEKKSRREARRAAKTKKAAETRKTVIREKRIWKGIVKQINDEEIRENIGLYIDDRGYLVSDDEITDEQFDVLIEVLLNRLESPDDSFEEAVLKEAIVYVERERDMFKRKQESNLGINTLGDLMARL